jgi:hypothetical protein
VTLAGDGVLGGVNCFVTFAVSVSDSLLELELEATADLGGVTLAGDGVLGGVNCFVTFAVSVSESLLLELLELLELLLFIGDGTRWAAETVFLVFLSASVSVSDSLLELDVAVGLGGVIFAGDWVGEIFFSVADDFL